MSRRREIRSERAQRLQRLRAGFFSRAVASGTDVLLALCVYVAGFVVASISWDLFFSKSVSLSVPPHWLNGLIVWVVLVVYLTAGWGSAGRTLGKQMMGLRVVRSDGSGLHFVPALLRAVLCATIFPVLLLALVSRRNQGLEDVIIGTVVVYDWLPEGAASLATAQMDAQLEIKVREVSGPKASERS